MPSTPVNRVFPGLPIDLLAGLRQLLASVESTTASAEAKELAFGILDVRMLLDRDYLVNQRSSRRRMLAAMDHHVIPIFLDLPLGDYQRGAAEYAQLRLEHGGRPATIRYEMACLRRGLNLAQRAGLIDRAPYIPSIRVENARKNFVTEEQFQTLRSHLPEPVRSIATFAYRTGWRRREILDLTWDRIDLMTQTLRLDPGSTKNGEGRTFPYGADPDLIDLIEHWHRRRHGRHLFHRRGKQVLHFRVTWAHATKAAKLPGLLLHDLRRSAVRNMERAGVPRSIAMRLTGHLTESIYKRYAVSNEADLAEGVAKMAAMRKR